MRHCISSVYSLHTLKTIRNILPKDRFKYNAENMDKYTVQISCNGSSNCGNQMIISMPPLPPPEDKDKKKNMKRKASVSGPQTSASQVSDDVGKSTATTTTKITSTTKIPESVLQYERQMRKAQAAKRASTPLSPSKLQIVHDDEQMIVINKPSGVLTVPGINSNPSMLSLLHEIYKDVIEKNGMKMEHMITHRLDMDTSGIVLYAKTKTCMSHIQAAFRDKKVTKSYEALVCGHLPPHVQCGSIDLPLQRDHRFPPFMRVATPTSERAAKEVVKDLQTAGFKKLVKKNPKPSQTLFEVVGREFVRKKKTDEDEAVVDADVNGGSRSEKQHPQEQQRFPVTRIKLTPITGRTHQLRVHCAAIGHPIVGDPTYGILCEASPNGGFSDDAMDEMMPTRASTNLQLDIDRWAKDVGQCMCLHAKELRIRHPTSGEEMTFEQAPAF